jgi:phosphoribosylanthranilate isomerase
MTRIKCCGITSAEDAQLCAEEGAHALGFVVEYPQAVPWNLTRTQARELMARVPPFIARVAVVGGSAETIIAIAQATQANAVQLHGDEPESVVESVARELAASGINIIKALRVDPAQPARDARWWQQCAQRFYDAGATALLVDSKTPARPAGTGLAVDWALARAVVEAAPCPVILAGGLNAQNVGSAIAAVAPHAVDVISSIEDAANRKVRERVRAFIRAASVG